MRKTRTLKLFAVVGLVLLAYFIMRVQLKVNASAHISLQNQIETFENSEDDNNNNIEYTNIITNGKQPTNPLDNFADFIDVDDGDNNNNEIHRIKNDNNEDEQLFAHQQPLSTSSACEIEASKPRKLQSTVKHSTVFYQHQHHHHHNHNHQQLQQPSLSNLLSNFYHSPHFYQSFSLSSALPLFSNSRKQTHHSPSKVATPTTTTSTTTTTTATVLKLEQTTTTTLPQTRPLYNNINNNNIDTDFENASSEQSANEIVNNIHEETKKRTNHWLPVGVEACGQQRMTREPRVVGGNASATGEFPWAVSIRRHGNHHCGGVIVGKRWVLTAAHCVRNQQLNNLLVRVGHLPDNDRLTTTLKSTSTAATANTRDYLVDKTIVHDDFYKQLAAAAAAQTQNSSSHSNFMKQTIASLLHQQQQQQQQLVSAVTTASVNNADIALIKLRSDIALSELAWPVCFPSGDAGSFSGSSAIVVGWGKLNEKNDDFSADLQKAQLTIIDNELCASWFRKAGRPMLIDERILCAGYQHGGTDACHGDSGGPLLARSARTGQFAVVGVVSTGIGCARPLLPGLYSRVSSYLSWIDKHVHFNG